MVKTSAKNITLSEFQSECNDLLNEVLIKINSSSTRTHNFDIHRNYKLDYQEIENRLIGITQKFRKCEMNYYLYFEDIHHDILTVDQRDLPISRQCTFIDGTAKSKQFFDVDDEKLYQEIINYQFQEFILFTASVIENLVYLAETLIRKVVVHLKNKQPPSIIMQNYIATLEILINLNYRTNDYISGCLGSHRTFFDTFLPTINEYRNRYIHGFSTKLGVSGSEYILIDPKEPIYTNSLNARVDSFAKAVIDNMKLLIPDFFVAITDTIKSAAFIPA